MLYISHTTSYPSSAITRTPCSLCYLLNWLMLKLTFTIQPDSMETSELDAWYMDDSEDDQRSPHR